MHTPKIVPPPEVAPESWRALFAVAAEFAALKPWKFMYNCDVVGLIDPHTGEPRIASVLGNADEVFGVLIYRRPTGLRWVLHAITGEKGVVSSYAMEELDGLKLEFVRKRELVEADLAVLGTGGFKPKGKGCVWPQFRSVEPGWLPWFINQAQAEQLLTDLPGVLAFCKLCEQELELFAERDINEIPFLPKKLPERPLTPADIDWRPVLIPPPSGLDPFQPPHDQLEKLRSFKHMRGLACEFDCFFLPGGSYYEQGRPCFARFGLLVERQRGLVVGMGGKEARSHPGRPPGAISWPHCRGSRCYRKQSTSVANASNASCSRFVTSCKSGFCACRVPAVPGRGRRFPERKHVCRPPQMTRGDVGLLTASLPRFARSLFAEPGTADRGSTRTSTPLAQFIAGSLKKLVCNQPFTVSGLSLWYEHAKRFCNFKSTCAI